MTKELLLERLQRVVAFAETNYIRLLIEVDPDFDRVYFYVDGWNYTNLHQAIIKAQVGNILKSVSNNANPIKVTLTNEKMYYIGSRPKLTILEVTKGDVRKSFYNPDVYIDKERYTRYILYFVGIHGKICVATKDRFRLLTGVLQVGELDDLVYKFEKYNYPKNYKINRLARNKLGLYKY